MLTVRLLAPSSRRLAWNPSMTFRVMVESFTSPKMPFHDLQPLAVEFDRALGVGSRLFRLQVVVDRGEQLDGRVRGASSPSIAARITSFSSRMASCQFVVASVEPGGHSGRRIWTPLTEKYVQYRRPRFQSAIVFSHRDSARQHAKRMRVNR